MKKMLIISVIMLLAGCTNLKVKLPSGAVILYQKVWTAGSAKKADLYYEDPNTTVWIVVNDPNSSVNRGKLMVRDLMTGKELGIESN